MHPGPESAELVIRQGQAMLAGVRSYIGLAPHLIMIPGFTLMVVVLAFNLLGDGLRDALDPKQRK